MRLSRLLPAVLLVTAGLTPASAADLTSLDRSLPDEPKYQTSTPGYCLLVFGHEAKTLVWLVQDGGIMHVYASPDGKAPRAWRQVKGFHSQFVIGDIWEDGGKTCYKNLHYYGWSHYPTIGVLSNGKTYEAGRDKHGKLAFATTAKDAPIIHFAGPLSLDLHHSQKPLVSGKEVNLSVVVGTPGVGPGTFAMLHCYGGYPPKAWPTAILELPAKEGGKPIMAKVRVAED
jgi:hypothetical protein